MNDGYYVTTVRRGCSLEGSGYLFYVDPSLTKVEHLLSVPSPLYPRDHVDKAFGGKRGFRGVRRWGRNVVVATFDSLMLVDRGGRVLDRLTHPLFCDIHGIEVTPEGIWLTSTGIDAVVMLGWDGRIHHTYFLSEKLADGKQPLRQIPRNCDFRRHVLTKMQVHPNYVSVDQGAIVVCCRRPGTLVRIDTTSGQVYSLDLLGRFSLPHDGRITRRGLETWYEVTETGTGRLHALRVDGDRITGRIVTSLGGYGQLDPDRPASRGRTSWLRGLCRARDGTYLVGQAPARLLLVRAGTLAKVLVLDDHPDSAVSDISPGRGP